MKIEKLSESRIKFTVSLEDMERWGISLESLVMDTPKARELFKVLIKRAEVETGFCADNARLMVEAQPGKGNAIILFVTNLDVQQAQSGKMRVRAKITEEKRHRIFKFENFDHVCDFVKIASGQKGGAMYVCEEKYYLVLSGICSALISEYGREILKGEITLPYLKEHGKCIIEDKALETIEKYFK